MPMKESLFCYSTCIFLSNMSVIVYLMKYILFKLFICQRIPLDFLQGDKFREAADNYIRPLLTKVYKIPFHIVLCLAQLFQN